MASDDDFFVIRRFEKLGARATLFLQSKIILLEEKLKVEDLRCRNAPEEQSDSGTFRDDPIAERTKIMEEITSNLERYRKVSVPLQRLSSAESCLEQFLLNHATLKARSEASELQISNVKGWMYNNNYPIVKEEATFIDQEGDLIPLVPKVKPPLRRLIDHLPIIGRTFFRKKRKNVGRPRLI